MSCPVCGEPEDMHAEGKAPGEVWLDGLGLVPSEDAHSTRRGRCSVCEQLHVLVRVEDVSKWAGELPAGSRVIRVHPAAPEAPGNICAGSGCLPSTKKSSESL